MTGPKQAYRHIFKATSIFGGAQVIQILASLVRAKFIALLLGPAGMGLASLFTVATTIVSNIAGLGLNFSAVREISHAAETNDENKLRRTITIFNRWMWFSGILGLIATVCLAPYLSLTTLGNKGYTISFIFLSAVVLLTILNNGNTALLQGMRRLKDTAKASVISAIVSVISAVPLYYFYGSRGIVPALIVAAATPFLTSWYFTQKIKGRPVPVSYRETVEEGQDMIKLGIVMMVSILLGSIANYGVNAFINYKGGVADVGLYQAGLSITNQFIGLVFLAMGVDYFPRLAAVNTDNDKVRVMANQQAEIAVLIVSQLAIFLLLSAPLVVHLLLSPAFYSITDFVRWTALGMIFKAASYAVGYISFAKGDKRVFFLMEGVMSNVLSLVLNVLAYNFGGLTGIGISFVLSYVIYFIIVVIVTGRLYAFRFNATFFKVFFISLILCFSVFMLMMYKNAIWIYVAGLVLFGISIGYSFREVDRRIGLKNFLLSKMGK